MLECVESGYAPSRPILKGVDLTLSDGESCAILGPSGSGKTTLLRTILGLLHPMRGAIRWPISDGGRRPPAGTLGYIPQNLGLVRNRTVRENVLVGCLGRLGGWRTLTGRFPADEVRAADDALARVGLATRGDERIEDLSGGERRRVAVARTLLQRPRLLLADEFLAELDRVTAGEILDLLEEIRAHTGLTLLCVEHNIENARRVADRILVMVEGRCTAELDAASAEPDDVAKLFKGGDSGPAG